jgi:hypothetical protein
LFALFTSQLTFLYKYNCDPRAAQSLNRIQH